MRSIIFSLLRTFHAQTGNNLTADARVQALQWPISVYCLPTVLPFLTGTVPFFIHFPPVVGHKRYFYFAGRCPPTSFHNWPHYLTTATVTMVPFLFSSSMVLSGSCVFLL